MEVSFDKNFRLQFRLEEKEKGKLLADSAKIFNQTSEMDKWFNNPKVSQEEKEKYKEIRARMLSEASFLYQLLFKCKITDEEIEAYMKLPFKDK